MSRYDGLIIPRSYGEYINKTDAATLQQALQLSGVLSGTVAAGDNKAIKSNAVNTAITKCARQIIQNQISIGKSVLSDNDYVLDISNLEYNKYYLIIFSGSYSTQYHYSCILFNGAANGKILTIGKSQYVNEPTYSKTNKTVTFTWANDPYSIGTDAGYLNVLKLGN